MICANGVIRRAEQSFVRSRLGTLGLTPADSFSLHTISVLGTCNQDALCVRLELDKGRVAKLLARLEAMGLVRRTVNASNKREKLVALTDAGRAALRQVDAAFSEWEEIELQSFTPDERRQYLAVLDRIAQNVARARRAGWPDAD